MEYGDSTQFGEAVHYGKGYIEKPDLSTAKSFMEAGNYLWNTNIFVWKIDNLLGAFRMYQPTAYKILRKIQVKLRDGSVEELKQLYGELEKISIDYAIMEKIKTGDRYEHIFVSGDFDWSDVGSFGSLSEMMQYDESNNRLKGNVKVSQGENCIVISDPPYKLYVKGLSGITVGINDKGNILVASHSATKNIKALLQSPVNINIGKIKDGFIFKNMDENGNVVNAFTRLMNVSDSIFDSDNKEIICAADVHNIAVVKRGDNVYVYNKEYLADLRAEVDIRDDVFGVEGEIAEANFKILIEEEYEQMSETAAVLLIKEINKVLENKDKVVIVFSAGSTPDKMYELLRTKYKDEVDWSKVILFQMDDYLGLSPAHPQSLAYYLMTKLIDPLGIKEFYLLNDEFGNLTMNLEEYEKKIQEFGGIDIIINGVGENGHLGFNEPYRSFKSRTRIVDLTKSTIIANSRFFSSADDVPNKAVTMGLATIFEAKKTFLLASGEKKQLAIRSAILGEIRQQVPVSILQRHSNVTIILDKEACSWIVSNIEVVEPNRIDVDIKHSI